MLLTEQEVQHAMKLIPADIKQAVLAGYETEDVYACRFMGMNANGTFVYEVDYEDTVSGDGTCKLYLRYVRGALAQGFYLVAEF